MEQMIYSEYSKRAQIGEHITFARPDIHCKKRTDTVVGFTEQGKPILVCKVSRSQTRHCHGSSFDKDIVYIFTQKEYNSLPMFNKECDYYAQLEWED